MKSGDITPGPPGTKYVRMAIEFWLDPKTEEIHIVAEGADNMHSTLNKKAGSKRCHQNLYGHLQRTLEKHGKWPDGFRGSEAGD